MCPIFIKHYALPVSVHFHNLISESKYISIHVWAVSLLDFYPSLMPILFFTFMLFLRIPKLAIQIVVSG